MSTAHTIMIGGAILLMSAFLMRHMDYKRGCAEPHAEKERSKK